MKQTGGGDIMRKTTRTKKGFTIMEMLIVVAIIAVLAAILIPTFNGALHKAKAAADIANVRAYYAELQTEYLLTGKYRNEYTDNMTFIKKIVFSDGSEYNLQVGWCGIQRITTKLAQGKSGKEGYSITYACDKGDHTLTL